MNSLDPQQARIFPGISAEIAHFYKTVSARTDSSGFGHRSGMWARERHPPYVDRILNSPLRDALQYVQSHTDFYYGYKGTSIEGQFMAEGQLDYLKSAGFDLDSAPAEIKESDLTNRDQITYYNGRPVSVDFLYRLNVYQRIKDTFSAGDEVVLEIGGGVGVMARTIKLFNPNTKYVIVDLLDTLVLSAAFLRANFPNASATFVADNVQLRQLEQLDALSDFTFIPAELVSDVSDFPRLAVDLVINTQSLGEMRQEVVEQYMALIENVLQAKRFYSLNRYLQLGPSVRWREETFQASYSTPIGPYWDVLRWEYCPKFINYRIGRDRDETLELYVQRVNAESVDQEQLRRRSDEMLAEATRMTNLRTQRWHRLMWDSIRLCPRQENVEPYYRYLKASDCREHRYFGRLLARWDRGVVEPYPTRVVNRKLRPLVAGKLRGLANRIEPPVGR